VYLVSVGAEEWFDDEEDGWGEVASALNAELRRRGLSPYEDVPAETDFAPGSGQAFEEKLTPPMTGFLALCQAHLSAEAKLTESRRVREQLRAQTGRTPTATSSRASSSAGSAATP
jgi:hypothetical protein